MNYSSSRRLLITRSYVITIEKQISSILIIYSVRFPCVIISQDRFGRDN